MSRFIESIKLSNGKFFRLPLHQQRINRIFDEFFPEKDKILLLEAIGKQDIPVNGLFKLRIVFDSEIESIEFIPYQLPNIKSLKIIETDLSATFYKPADREKINHAFAQKGNCDDILLVKNGFVTDTSYCNVAFFDGKEFFTPEKPLIYGVQRAELLVHNKIKEKQIAVGKIHSYPSVYLFNAMIEFGEIVMNTENIILT